MTVYLAGGSGGANNVTATQMLAMQAQQSQNRDLALQQALVLGTASDLAQSQGQMELAQNLYHSQQIKLQNLYYQGNVTLSNRRLYGVIDGYDPLANAAQQAYRKPVPPTPLATLLDEIAEERAMIEKFGSYDAYRKHRAAALLAQDALAA